MPRRASNGDDSWCYDLKDNTTRTTTDTTKRNNRMRIKRNNPFSDEEECLKLDEEPRTTLFNSDACMGGSARMLLKQTSSKKMAAATPAGSLSRMNSYRPAGSSRNLMSGGGGGNMKKNPFDTEDEEDASLISSKQGTVATRDDTNEDTDDPKLQEQAERQKVRKKRFCIGGIALLVILIISLGVSLPMVLMNKSESGENVDKGPMEDDSKTSDDEDKDMDITNKPDNDDEIHANHTDDMMPEIPTTDDDEGNESYYEEPVTSWARLSRTYDDPSILEGYGGTHGCSHFQSDIEKAIKLMADIQIDRHAQIYYHKVKFDEFTPRGGQLAIGSTLFDGDIIMQDMEDVPDAMPTQDASSKDKTTTGESSYGTNNQVDGVDEADYVKSDGELVYAGYANELVIWHARTGKEVSRTVLPLSDEDGVPICTKEAIDTPPETAPDAPSPRNEANSSLHQTQPPCYVKVDQSRMYIESLVLHENRIVVIAKSPSLVLNKQVDEKSYVVSHLIPDLNESNRILSGHRSTRIFVYDTSSLQADDLDLDGEASVAELSLVAQKDLDGEYKSARLIGPNVHVVTTSNINTAMFMRETSPWSLQNTYEEFGEEEYKAIARNITDAMVPTFTQRLVSEVLEHDRANHMSLSKDAIFQKDVDQCKKLARIALMLKPSKDRKTVNGSTSAPSFTTANALKTYTRITSFNIPSAGTDSTEQRYRRYRHRVLTETGPDEEEDEDVSVYLSKADTDDMKGAIEVSNTGIFLPITSYTSNIYASKDVLVITGEAYKEDYDGHWHETTVVYSFGLVNDEVLGKPSTKAMSVGEVPGSLLNQFSIDHQTHDDGGDYLRIATTTWAKYAYEERSRSWIETSESSSQVSVFQLPSTSRDEDLAKMKMVGQIRGLGMGERIYAVRFLGGKGFVVTFKQIDPFYTLNLADPFNPELVGELKIPGFSNYLHPIEGDNFILAVGQDADITTGQTVGLQISVFNVTDLSSPTQVQKYVEAETSSSSHAQHDHKAFRYLDDSKVLILPTSHRQDDGSLFDGFVIFDIDVTIDIGIKKRFSISHVDEERTCWYMAPRSLVFDGSLTTMKGNTAKSHDLATEEHQWTLNFDEGTSC